MSKPSSVVAFCYDFDGTLAPGYMQDHAFIPELNVEKTDFWATVKAKAKAQKGDEVHAYMNLMVQKARGEDIKIDKKSWKMRGKTLPLFTGVEGWFSRQNSRADALGVKLEHYVISSGIREMIEGSSIASNFKKIYASAFSYDTHGVPNGIALGVNYTNKTQYLFRINKGTLNEWDDKRINKYTPPSRRHVPFEQMVFFGDGETDVPCMRLVSEQNGHAVAIWDAKKAGSKETAEELIKLGRAKLSAEADYSKGSKLDKIAETLLNYMANRRTLLGLS